MAESKSLMLEIGKTYLQVVTNKLGLLFPQLS